MRESFLVVDSSNASPSGRARVGARAKIPETLPTCGPIDRLDASFLWPPPAEDCPPTSRYYNLQSSKSLSDLARPFQRQDPLEIEQVLLVKRPKKWFLS